MIRTIVITVMLTGAFFLTGCSNDTGTDRLQKVGLLLETTIDDQTWNRKGYAGLISIRDTYDVEMFVKEEVQNRSEINRAVDELVKNGVNLIFGHSNVYGRPFVEIAPEYPHVHFVYFNGGHWEDNVTTFNFNTHAMGFFAGMVAGKMTTTNHVSIIAAYEWQPEIEGFYEGVKFQNADAQVRINYVNDWNDEGTALDVYNTEKNEHVDVFYPAADVFNEQIVTKASEDNLYAIGYMEDQSQIDPDLVLTSTIQHVEKLYTYAAEQYNDEALTGGVETFDFQDGMVAMGPYSDDMPGYFQTIMHEAVNTYIESNLLPNERAID